MEYVLAENKYGKYAIPSASQHRPACKIVIDGGVWEPDTIEFMLNNCGSGTIIHAGAYFGDFIPALGNLSNVVYAFEPSTENFQHAEETIRLNGSRVALINAALGEKSSTGRLWVVNNNGVNLGGTAHLVPFNSDSENDELFESVEIVALDDVVDDHSAVSIIQLDVEGTEIKALRGAKSIIQLSKPIIIIEVWNENILNDPFFTEFLLPLGYERSESLHDNVVYRIN